MSLQRHLKIVELNKDRVEDRFMETAIKVAFATTDMKTVNQHFGSAQAFAIYAVDIDKSLLVEVMQFSKLEQNGNEDKLIEKIDALQECIAVYSQAVGASAVSQLKSSNIQPIKVVPGSSITEMLKLLQEELRLGPSIWLARAIDQSKDREPARFDDMESEGWDE